MTNKNKLKLVEELLCESDLSTVILFDILKKRKVTKREKRAGELLDLIYRIIHPAKRCPHWDWEKENEELFKRLCKKS